MIGPATSLTTSSGSVKKRQPMSRFKRICVFGGNSQGKKTTYRDAAMDLATQLVLRDIDLVYGGGSVGLMGLISEAVYRGGRHVTRIIPETPMTRKMIGETVGEVRLVADMHQKKAEMTGQSDAFITLPGRLPYLYHDAEDQIKDNAIPFIIKGGYGTLEGLLEVITWAQLGIHRKPVGLLNVDGYYDSLLTFIDQAVGEGFISPSARRIIVWAPTARELMEKLEEYVPYYDEVASGLKWAATRVTHDAGDDPAMCVTALFPDTPREGDYRRREEEPGAPMAKRARTPTVRLINGPE